MSTSNKWVDTKINGSGQYSNKYFRVSGGPVPSINKGKERRVQRDHRERDILQPYRNPTLQKQSLTTLVKT